MEKIIIYIVLFVLKVLLELLLRRIFTWILDHLKKH